METPTLRTSQDITHIYFYNNLLTKLYLYEQKVVNQLCRPPHLEHPKTLPHTHIYIYFYNDLLTQLYLYEHKVINQLRRPPHLEHPKTLQHIYIRSSTHTEYGIEILASPGIPGIELEKLYLQYSRIQLTSKNLYLEYRWTI